ncbi:MAG: hypothetical protein OZ921_00975 [Sorangiineae bacterium]|nr:hypothetical protein [Polyangiaceae bacterium]MEB2321056.1 hypothetical protein [Sorangiineae bacterium]
MSSLRRAIAPMCLGLAALAFTPIAQAEDANTLAEARRLYTDAARSFKDQRYKEAALGFEAASALHAHAVALYTAAQAWEMAGEPARAADDFSLALSTPKLSESQAARARERLDALEQELGTVVVLGDDSTKVQLGGHSEFHASVRLHGEPGEHTLLIIKATGQVERRVVSLTAGATVEVDTRAPARDGAAIPRATPLAPPAKHPVDPESNDARPSSGSATLRTVGYALAGAGLGALGGAVFLGLSANDAKSAYDGTPTRDTYDHAKSLERNTNLMLIAGGVLTAGGVGLVLWQSTGGRGAAKATVGLRATPSAFLAEGSF